MSGSYSPQIKVGTIVAGPIDTPKLGHIDGSIFHATYKNGRTLGLWSYNTVIAKTTWPGPDTTTWGRDDVDVALPVVEMAPLPGIPTIYNDTIFIDHQTMMLESDIRLRLRHDGSGNEISPDAVVDSAGYKYKSRWVSSENFLPLLYYRQYPADDSYLWWDGVRGNCQVDIFRWDLYAIGGELTLEAIGALNPVPNINNSFHEVTDSIISAADSIRTKKILIDSDPPNALFLDSLEHDIIKAIGWVEYAGSYDNDHHCHSPYNPRYNNYWDHVYGGGATCFDSLTPCENIASTATGTMQMLRTVWDDAFESQNYIPQGYFPARWDSIAWNWKINIHNGKYIYFTDNYFRINNDIEQRMWDSTCVLCNPADSLPQYPNKEDLSTFGYKYGAPVMDTVTASNWKNVMKSSIGRYVRQVRGSKYARPWQD